MCLFMIRKLFILVFLLSLSLGGCGRKPAGLKPPESASLDAYPQVYPRPLPGENPSVAPQTDLVSKYKARPEQSLQ